MKNPWKNKDFARYWKLLPITIPLITIFVVLYLSSAGDHPFFLKTLFVSNCTNIQHNTDHLNLPDDDKPSSEPSSLSPKKKELDQSKIAVCLVGGARNKFELTGPSIVENILKEYPNADLFLHSSLDGDSFKLSLLKAAPRLASIRIFKPTPIPETPEQIRLLSLIDTPNGIQGLLQYFSLVEGCLTLIKAYQKKRKFTYNWIVRARLDGYWNAPLEPESFIPGTYVVPSGSDFWGLNDRHGVGDFNTSVVALSRFSILPTLIADKVENVNSERAFKAQFTTHGTPYVTKRLPFCVLSDRRLPFPPLLSNVPVGATSSPGPLSGVNCRPCSFVCQGKCVADMMIPISNGGGWTDWENGTLQLCDPRGPMENGWEQVFDIDAGEKLAAWTKEVMALKLKDCIRDFKEMRRRTAHWDVPPPDEKPPALNTSSMSPPPRVPSWKEKLDQSKIAVCLVGGARKFELTGPSIVENILKEYPNADLFLHSPIDEDSFKFSLLKAAPRLASIRIFKQTPIPETPELLRLLTPIGSPNGIQGLLQYFSLVEGCLALIKAYQSERNFTYDWIVRARVDGYWNAPLGSDSFIPGTYVVPSGSAYWGLNDRHGVGDFNTSIVALSRFSILPTLVAAGLTNFNSESAFKAQFTTHGTPYVTKRLPFCVVSDRKYRFPPIYIPVGATSSPGPLSGTKCRPCSSVCQGKCVADLMIPISNVGGWTDWENGTLQLCDSRGPMENGWEQVFDIDAGEKLAAWRRQVMALKLKDCIRDFKEMRNRTAHWDVPPPEEVCKLGLGTK